MELQIKPYQGNPYPLGGALLKGGDPAEWLAEMQRMGLTLHDVAAYPIPNPPNSLKSAVTEGGAWSCFLHFEKKVKNIDIRKNICFQHIENKFFIPENTQIYPLLTASEIEKLLLGEMYLMHPDWGLVCLSKPIKWKNFLEMPQETLNKIITPIHTPFIPQKLRLFEVRSIPPEETIEKLENNEIFERKTFESKPLNFFEKLKLKILQKLFKRSPNLTPTQLDRRGISENSLLDKLFMGLGAILGSLFGGLFDSLAKQTEAFTEKLKMSLEELEKRNKENADKLLDLFKDNPEEALKYAIPLNTEGTARGSNEPALLNFSQFGTSSGSGGSVVLPDNTFWQLHQQYQETAEMLKQQGKYEKAAHIYLKLLGNKLAAAQTYEAGKYYSEAASIYLKYLNDKYKAALCYEKGNMYSQAIVIYQELNEYEKVGNLYMALNETTKAKAAYEKVVEKHLEEKSYVKAAVFLREKLNDKARAQTFLKTGWLNNHDAFNCLNNYFVNISDEKQLEEEIQRLYEEINPIQKNIFLNAIKLEYGKHESLKEPIETIAYEIIADLLQQDAFAASELRFFHKDDKNLLKDIIRYKRENK